MRGRRGRRGGEGEEGKERIGRRGKGRGEAHLLPEQFLLEPGQVRDTLALKQLEGARVKEKR